MNPALKLDVFIFHPSYGGNGGISSEVPQIREWEVQTVLKMKSDPRVGEIHQKTIADTPITMVRNQAVRLARQQGAHLLLMVDSDINPNLYSKESWFVPFWDAAFNAIYEHYGKGPLVVGAPYCGPPPHENVYIFQFDNDQVVGDETPIHLDQYTRAEASKMRGIQECAALPTGMILYDMRAFELIEPDSRSQREILEEVAAGRMTTYQAQRALSEGWFYYEWKDSTASQKASTEDVTNTRDLALAGCVKLGYNPLRCAWDSWVGHWKPWCVGKPNLYKVDNIAATFQRAVLSDRRIGEHTFQFDRLKELGISEEDIQRPSPRPKLNIPPSVPERVHPYIKEREVCGKRILNFGHMTPRDHLEGLRKLVAHERAAKGRPLLIVEIGTWVGESALALASGDDDSEIYCVDTFKGSPGDWTGQLSKESGGPDVVTDILKQNLGDLWENRVFVWSNKSVLAARYWGLSNRIECQESKNPWADCHDGSRSQPIDIIFIDADHDDVSSDILAWLPHLADDGVMIGHDYMVMQFPNVKTAVHDIFKGKAEPYCFSQDYGGFWFIKMEDFHEAETAGADS